MDSYRLEKRAVQQIMLPDEDAEIEPVPTSGGSQSPEPEMERLSKILKTFNDLFGDKDWDDRDRVVKLITNTIPAKVAADTAFRNARKNSDEANVRIEHDAVLTRIVTSMMKDDAMLFKQLHARRADAATKLGMTGETLRRWGRQAERDIELGFDASKASSRRAV